MIRIDVSGASAIVRKEDVLTVGMVGAKVEFRFDEAWEELSKTAVFRQGEVTRDVIGIDTTATVPAEVLALVGTPVQIGVYGANTDGSIVIPTIWAKTKPVRAGADPSGDESTDPRLPIWQQLQEQIGDLDDLDTEDKSTLVAAINEALTKGGGEADPEEITKIVNEYLAVNPPEDGADGRGIVSIARTSGDGSAGTVDTYTITYTDETTSAFQVRNGSDGQDGADGKDGNDGKDGADGKTPYIGEMATGGLGIPIPGSQPVVKMARTEQRYTSARISPRMAPFTGWIPPAMDLTATKKLSLIPWR